MIATIFQHRRGSLPSPHIHMQIYTNTHICKLSHWNIYHDPSIFAGDMHPPEGIRALVREINTVPLTLEAASATHSLEAEPQAIFGDVGVSAAMNDFLNDTSIPIGEWLDRVRALEAAEQAIPAPSPPSPPGVTAPLMSRLHWPYASDQIQRMHRYRQETQSSLAPPQGGNVRWVHLRWLGGDREEGTFHGDIRYPIDGVSNFLDMANEGDIPGIPRAQNGNYELIWNGEVVERHIRLIDLGIQNNDELILVFRPQFPEHLRRGGAFRR